MEASREGGSSVDRIRSGMTTGRQSAEPDHVSAILGARITRRMEERGIRIADVARACGVQWQTAQLWAQGKRRPDIQYVPKLLGVLGMTANELLGMVGGDDPPWPSWETFLASPEGRLATSDELATLRAIAWPPGRTPTVSSYLVALSALRSTEAREG